MSVLTDLEEALHPITVDDYHRMLEVGILSEDDRCELLDGAIIEMSPEGPPHITVAMRLTRFLVRAVTDDSLCVLVGNPITLRPDSEPEPDFSVVDAASVNFREQAQTAYLAVEVAHSSLRKDLVRKARIYARAGIPEYWVVDLRKLCVHVHREPQQDGFASIEIVAPPAPLQAISVELPPLDLVALFDAG